MAGKKENSMSQKMLIKQSTTSRCTMATQEVLRHLSLNYRCTEKPSPHLHKQSACCIESLGVTGFRTSKLHNFKRKGTAILWLK